MVVVQYLGAPASYRLRFGSQALAKLALRATTGGSAALAASDLSRKPQPAWGNDPFNTRMHLEQDRLFAKSDTGSAKSAMRMYNSVAHF